MLGCAMQISGCDAMVQPGKPDIGFCKFLVAAYHREQTQP
jgi:hypothetical protein